MDDANLFAQRHVESQIWAIFKILIEGLNLDEMFKSGDF